VQSVPDLKSYALYFFFSCKENLGFGLCEEGLAKVPGARWLPVFGEVGFRWMVPQQR